jgi:hypothetical protein
MSKQIVKNDNLDARYKSFKERIKRLGYIKADAKKVNAVIEKVADFGMMSDAGNKKVARAVSQAKDEKDLRARLDKIASMKGGKYVEASEDEVIMRAVNALDYGAQGTQKHADANVLVQLAGIDDTGRDTDVRTDDMKKTKVKAKDASMVYHALMSIKAPLRSKYLNMMQKDSKGFSKAFNAILKVAKK